MSPFVVLAALSVAFPREGQVLPAVSSTYVIGAVDAGVEALSINGTCITPYRTGAWTAMVPVISGSNTLVVAAGGESREVHFKVASPSPAPSSSASAAKPKVYGKLEYAQDEAKLPPLGRRPQEITIALDAGHGGTDAGAISPRGFLEKDFNLAMALAVRDELRNLGYRVVTTRDEDSFLPLYDRPRVAHQENADAFVSLHYNAPPCNKDPATLRYHAVYAWNAIGERLAAAINHRMGKVDGYCTNNGVIHANFAVTRNPEIPSCLIETDFITNPRGEELATDPEFRAKLAKAIADGIADWCAKPQE